MNEDTAIEVVKNAFEVVIENNPLGSFILKMINDQQDDLFNERINYLDKRINDLESFKKNMSYLIDDTNKYIHVRNFLSFYFTKTDPALVETNVKIFLDYINEKSNKNSYDILLEKICLLNKEALNILKKIKNNLKEDNYYQWKEFIVLYPTIDSNLDYRKIITSKELNDDMLEISFGMKSLVENDFIITLSATSVGSIDIHNIDVFSLTNLGYLILDYI